MVNVLTRLLGVSWSSAKEGLVLHQVISITSLLQVVAVDKGAGWGEFEGKAIVFSDPLFYKSRAFREDPPPPPPPDPLVLARESMERKYPTPLCRSVRQLPPIYKT